LNEKGRQAALGVLHQAVFFPPPGPPISHESGQNGSPLGPDTIRDKAEVLVAESALHLYNDDLMNWEVRKETVW
jgi:hypothetical protein